jgi:hypothetical protein
MVINKPQLIITNKQTEMTRNEELIEKYKRWINKAEKEMEKTQDQGRYLFLDGKVMAYKMVIIDLLE